MPEMGSKAKLASVIITRGHTEASPVYALLGGAFSETNLCIIQSDRVYIILSRNVHNFIPNHGSKIRQDVLSSSRMLNTPSL